MLVARRLAVYLLPAPPLHVMDSWRHGLLPLLLVFCAASPAPMTETSNLTCSKPNTTQEWTNCQAKGGDFPAKEATCQCTRCQLTVVLVCGANDTWDVTSEGNVCASNHSKTLCGKCNKKETPADVKCSEFGSNGFWGEKRECACRRDCRAVALRCESDGVWRIANYSSYHCNETLPFHSDVDSSGALGYNVSVRGLYEYWCSPGHQLVGPRVLLCSNGSLNGTAPACKTITEERSGRSSDDGARDQGGRANNVRLDVVLIGSGTSLAAVAAILGLYFWVQRRRKQGQQRSRTEVAETNEACQQDQLEMHQDKGDGMISNDMYMPFEPRP